jgi:hypothetical protein
MASTMSSAERKLRSAKASYTSWANTDDPTERTEPARQAFRESFEVAVDPDGTLTPQERARRGAQAYKAHMAGLALKSARARRAKATAKAKATADPKAAS